jgi:1-acyl-sn-glycerol-3-phosphate acyltransferase
VIGWLLSSLGHIPIERENREKAIASLEKAIAVIHESVGANTLL